MTNVRRVLGLDPGIKSLGWALIEEKDNNEAVNLIDAGSIIFNPVFEPKDLKLKNQKRTESRQARRQRDRTKRRLAKVENFLIKNSLLSKPLDDFKEFNSSVQAELNNPYYLRSEALKRYLTSDELSYTILHLFRKRGFYSSLKSKSAEEKKKDAQSQNLMQRVRDSKSLTIGQYFWSEIEKDKSTRVRGGEKYSSILEGEKLLRDNLCDELELIIEKQIEFGHTILNLTDNDTNVVIKDELIRLFKFQRPLKPQKRRSFCKLERKIASFEDKKTKEIKIREIGQKTAHKFHVFSQEFIIRQNINNLRIEDIDLATGEVHNINITEDDREFFFAKAWKEVSGITFKAIRKRLNISDEAIINLEYGNKKGIEGNQLLKFFTGSLKKWFNGLPIEKQAELMNDIHTIKGAEYLGLRNRLINYWGLNDDECDIFIGKLESNLKPQYISVSKKAAEKILIELRKGLIFSDACKLIYNSDVVESKESLNKLPPFPYTTNPIVNKSGSQVRKLVNKLIDKYGKIDVVRIELARDLGLSSKGLNELKNKQRKQEKVNIEARMALEEADISTTNVNIEKYKLWKETKEESLFPEKRNGKWVYPKISFADVFSSTGRFEREHLLPLSESGDDSFMNKSLCPSGINEAKGNGTPFDYYLTVMSEDELKSWKKRIHQILGDNPKKKRFFMNRKQMEEFVSSKSSLNDTRYVTRLIKEYFEPVIDKVETVKGGQTAMMRHELNLNTLLGNKGFKSRLDLRHHMVDALAIALLNVNNLNSLKEIRHIPRYKKKVNNKSKYYLKLTNKINSRYSKVRNDFENKFNSTFVEHEIQNKPSGSFDEETIYSLMHVENVILENGEYSYAKVSKLKSRGIQFPEKIEDLDDDIYKDCKFITSKSAMDTLIGKTVKDILNQVYNKKIILPEEIIFRLQEMDDKIKIEKVFELNSGNTLKKIKHISSKPSPDKVHFVRNKEKNVIGFKKLGNNACIIGFNSGNPRVVSLFEYLNNPNLDKNDVIFKGTILEDQNGERWKVYQFNNNELISQPINLVNIDKDNYKKLNMNKDEQNVIRKSFSYYLKNKFYII